MYLNYSEIKELSQNLETSEIVILAISELSDTKDALYRIWQEPTDSEDLEIKKYLQDVIIYGINCEEFEADEEFYWGENSFTLSTLDRFFK